MHIELSEIRHSTSNVEAVEHVVDCGSQTDDSKEKALWNSVSDAEVTMSCIIDELDPDESGEIGVNFVMD